jgi:hypothetical protein
MVSKTGGKALDNHGALFHLLQQQATAVGGDRTAIKPPHNLPLIHTMKFEQDFPQFFSANSANV